MAKRNNKNFNKIAHAITGQAINIIVNSRPEQTVRTGMTVKELKGTCLTTVSPKGEVVHFTLREDAIDEQKDGTVHVYCDQGNKPYLMWHFSKAG